MMWLSKDMASSQRYLAMYSSVFNGFTTDPAAMVIPMDDHMVHRGHGVFDTATIKSGYRSSSANVDVYMFITAQAV